MRDNNACNKLKEIKLIKNTKFALSNSSIVRVKPSDLISSRK